MKVLILAAGEGKRMKPIQTYKSMLKFLGKELILHKIETMEKSGLNDFVIVCNPNDVDKMKGLVGEKAKYAVQKEPKGMADAILSAKDLLKGEEVIITNAEDIVDENAYGNLIKVDCDSCLVGKKVREYFPGGYFKLEGDRIVRIIEKPQPGTEPSNLISIGIYFHRNFDKLAEYIENAKTDKDDQYETAMDNMMKDGFVFKVSEYDGKWVPLKYPWHILDAMRLFFESMEGNISPNAEISSNATINGKVIIEDGVKIFENAVINGPCYIGKNSIIGTNVLVRESVVSEDCIIGFGSEIARSYICRRTMAHMSYVGDSIIMDNCNLGAGTVTGNWRFDAQPVKVDVSGEKISTGMEKFGCIMGENCKTGINVSIMPGKKLGPNSMVGPGVCLQDNLEANKIIFVDKKSYVIKENA